MTTKDSKSQASLRKQALAAATHFLQLKGFSEIEEVDGYKCFNITAREGDEIAFIKTQARFNEFPDESFDRKDFEKEAFKWFRTSDWDGVMDSIACHIISFNVSGSNAMLRMHRNVQNAF